LDDTRLIELIDRTIEDFQGDQEDLERAIGMLVLGRMTGWRVVYLTHDRTDVRCYERLLGIRVERVLPEVGPLSGKSAAWCALDGPGNFWRAIGREPAGIRTLN